MLNLIKYEFIKKTNLVIALILSIIVNLFLVLKFQTQGSAMFIGLFPLVIMTLYVVDVISMYSRDLNNKSGYMLFMTPNSGYKIIFSKLITAIIEGILILVVYFLIILINGMYVGLIFNVDYNEVFSFINTFLSGAFQINLGHVFVFLISALIFIINFILSVYTAITIRKSIFSEIKLSGILSFVIFILINWLNSYMSATLMSSLEHYYESITYAMNTLSVSQLINIVLPSIVLSIIQSIIMAIASGYLLENKINL